MATAEDLIVLAITFTVLAGLMTLLICTGPKQ